MNSFPGQKPEVWTNENHDREAQFAVSYFWWGWQP